VISQDLQKAWISKFACEQYVLGGQWASIFFFYFLFFFGKNTQKLDFWIDYAAILQLGSSAEDPNDN